MSKHEIEKQIRQACEHAAPDVWNAVLSDCKEEKGRVFMIAETKKRISRTVRIAAMAACFCLIAGSAFIFHNYQLNHNVATTVSLDVNPSIEIQVNQKERVLDVVPLNEDGEIIVADMDFSGSDLDVAVYAIIGSMLQNGYLNELTNSILISVDDDDPTRSAELRERLTAEVNKLLKTESFDGSVLSQTVAADDELRQLAEKYGITPGKAQLIRAILAQSSLHRFEDLVPLSINELNLLLKSKEDGGSQLEVVGKASDKAYIGKAKAKEIALAKAGVSGESLTAYKIELDYDDGVMIYDVDFRVGSDDYDCEINAKSGDVLKFEKETLTGAAGAGTGSGSSAGMSSDKAKNIAFGHAGVSSSSVSGCRSELDYDDGVNTYELKFRSGGYEYEYEINAKTGAVIKAEKEYHGSGGTGSGKSQSSGRGSPDNAHEKYDDDDDDRYDDDRYDDDRYDNDRYDNDRDDDDRDDDDD